MGGGRDSHVIRLLAPAGALAAGAVVPLDEEESRHLTVRRAEPGATITLLDGEGTSATGRLERSGRHWSVSVVEVLMDPRPVPVTLAAGAGDRERFALMVEQVAQLGATAIIPLVTERTSGVATQVRGSHIDRFRRRGREALKQCGGAWAPAIAAPTGMDQFLAGLDDGARWLADLDGGAPSSLGAGQPVTIVVGPEGGFTAGERRRFLEAGFHAVRLGPHLLRFETAATAALAAVWLSREEH